VTATQTLESDSPWTLRPRRDAYSFCIGAAEQTILEATGLTKLEIATDTTPATDNRKAVLVGSGKEVSL